MQVKYPSEYNGAIACAPDPIDFRALLPLNIYTSSNAFRSSGSSNCSAVSLQLKEDVTGLAREYTGKMLASLEDEFHFEAAIGGALSGGQIAVWMAVYGPRDGTTGPSQPGTPFAPRSVRRALLMPQVHPGSLYRCGKSH